MSRHHHTTPRHIIDVATGLVILGIGALALIQWSLLFGFLLMAVGMEQSGLAQTLVERRRRNAQLY